MLPKKRRIKKKKDFDDIFKKGKTIKNAFFIIKIKSNELSFSRFAFIAPSKIFKKATERNEIKRRVVEAIKSVSVLDGYDVVVLIKEDVKRSSYKEIKNKMEEVLNKAELL